MKKLAIVLMILVSLISLSGISLADLNDGLVAYYPFDGNANDESGNGNDGTEHGGVTYVSGEVGQAISFDGIDDYVRIPSALKIQYPLAVSLWVKVGQLDRTFFSSDNRVACAIGYSSAYSNKFYFTKYLPLIIHIRAILQIFHLQGTFGII